MIQRRVGYCLAAATLVLGISAVQVQLTAAAVKPNPFRTVTVKIPRSAFQRNQSFWAGLKLTAEIERAGEGVLVEGRDDWHLQGFPSMIEARVKSAKERKKKGYTEVILFYGAEYEGDGFFWGLDKSGSMQHEGRMTVLKGEVGRAVDSLSSNSHFGLVAFSQNQVLWRTTPHRATAENKVSAKAWLQTLVPSGGTMMGPGGVAVLNLCNQSDHRRKTMIIVGDGVPSDGQRAVNSITAANYQRVPIHTILIGDDDGVTVMQRLAQQNNGTYRRVLP